MTAILFLDIDGVLNGHDYDEKAASCSIRPGCVAHLNGGDYEKASAICD